MNWFGSTSRFLLLALVALLVVFSGHVHSASAQATQDTTRIAFDEAIRIALDQNTDLRRAQGDVDRTSAQVQSERMDFVPDLRVSSGVDRNFGRTFSQEQVGFINESTDYFDLNARSGVTIFNGFENVASLREAGAQAEASELDYQQTRRDVVFEVMDRFITLVENREIVRVREEELEARRQQLRQIEEFVDAGSRPVSDLYQEQARVAESEQSLLQAQRDLEVSQTRLINTLQLDPRQAYRFEVPNVDEERLGAETYELSTLMDEAFSERLDLRVAEAEQRAAEQGVRVAKSSYYPSISISGNYGTRWTSRPREIPDPETGQSIEPGFSRQLDNNRSGSISLSLSIPVFDQLQRNVQVERAQVQARNAQYALEDQRQQVALQVRQAYLDYQNAVQQLEAANKRLQAAEQARSSAQERYNLGSASIVELQNATRDYVDAASQQIRARYNLLFQQKRIDYNVGRLNSQQPNLLAEPTNR